MREICKSCGKPAPSGTFLCPHCGSHLEGEEDRTRRRWPVIVILVVAAIAAAAFLWYAQKVADDRAAAAAAAAQAEPVARPVRQLSEEEKAQREREQQREKMIREGKERARAQREADALWVRSTPEAKVAWLKERIATLTATVQGMKKSAVPDTATQVATMETRLSAAQSFLDAGQLNQARGSLLAVEKSLDEIRSAAAGAASPTTEPPSQP